jgi:hypothetical protein
LGISLEWPVPTDVYYIENRNLEKQLDLEDSMILKEYHNGNLENFLKHEGNLKECSTHTMRLHISQNLAVLLLELLVLIIMPVLGNTND